MPIVTVSRGSYSRGKEVAEKVAQSLGYECISREVLVEASEEFNVPEVKLMRAIRHAPHCLDRFSFSKERYVAYIQAALLAHLQRDNVVYHGFAGHFFVTGVAHVVKIRILADTSDRVNVVMEREGIPEEKAFRVLEAIDDARKRWGLHLYGIDPNDPSLYDMVIHIKKLSTDDAAEIIRHTVGLGRFQATAESQQTMDDLLLAARVKAGLIEQYPRVNVAAEKGQVYVTIEGASAGESDAIEEVIRQVPGVEKTEIVLHPFLTPD